MSDGKVHSRFGGSIADRWMNCEGSVALCAAVPPEPSSSYANEGTFAHSLAEACLSNGCGDARDYCAKDPVFKDVDGEMADAVNVYLETITAELAEGGYGAELHTEQEFVFPGMNGEVYGRNDALIYSPSRKKLTVLDYKHGVGVSVFAENNAQLKFYATGALMTHPEWQVSTVELVIVQPRSLDVERNGAVRRWCFDVLDVLDFDTDVNKGWLAASKPGATRHPGSWCHWCPAAAVCRERETEVLRELGLQFEGVNVVDVTELEDPVAMDLERLAQVIKGAEILAAWASQVRQFAEERMVAGQIEIPGWKVVQKIGRAKWNGADENIVAELDIMWGLTDDDIRPRKMEGLGVVEKAMRGAGASKDEVEAFKARYTIKESSGLTIAPESDRRAAAKPVKEGFSGVNVEN